MADLDKGGNDLQRERIFYGPSVGWLENLNPTAIQANVNDVLTSGGSGGGGGGGVGWPNTINIADFGATGNGSTDDTAAINAAYASLVGTSGLVLWPAGTYRTTDSIKIGGPDTTGSTTSFINTICPAGPIRTVVSYNGPTDGRGAVRYIRNKYAFMDGLGVTDPRGIAVASGTGNSSGSTSLTVSAVTGTIQVGSFIYGADVNNVFNALVITGQISGTPGGAGVYQTNNLTTVGGTSLSFFPPTRGLSLGGAGADFGNWCLECTFSNLAVGGGFCMGVSDGFGIPLSGNAAGACSEAVFTHLQVSGNTHGVMFNDFNSLDNQFISLSMTGNNIGLDTGSIDSIWIYGGSSSGDGIDFFIQQNSDLNIYSYRSEAASTCISTVPGNAGAVTAHNVKMRAIAGPVATRQAINGNPLSIRLYGCEVDGNIVFSNISSFSRAINIENCTVFPDANGFPFTWGGGSNQFVNMRSNLRLKDNTCHGNSPNSGNVDVSDFEGVVNGCNTGTLTFEPLIHRKTDQAFAPGDVPLGVPYQTLMRVRCLSEGPMPGALVDTASPPAVTTGKNLRITAKFASSNSVVVNFIRAISVSGTGSFDLINGAAGTFLASDIGKPMTIPGKGNSGQTDWKGSITKVNSATQVTVISQRPQNSPTSFAATPGTIGENEPDASYIVTGLCGNANETFWVSAQTNTGFTLNSSNATSTATVNCMIVR